MTATSARNNFGIFKSKNAKLLAIKYSLDLYDKNAYISNNKFINYSDVKFIVDNLWIDHFIYDTNKPINISYHEYCNIYNYLKKKNPYIFNY